MTEAQKLQIELNEMSAKRDAVIKENTVYCNAPATRKPYTYMKGVSLRSIV